MAGGGSRSKSGGVGWTRKQEGEVVACIGILRPSQRYRCGDRKIQPSPPDREAVEHATTHVPPRRSHLPARPMSPMQTLRQPHHRCWLSEEASTVAAAVDTEEAQRGKRGISGKKERGADGEMGAWARVGLLEMRARHLGEDVDRGC